MMNLGVALGLPKSLPSGDIQCGACLISKSVNKNTLSSDSRSFLPMDTWNVDLVGPFEEPALSGGLYILTIRDIGSGYCEIKVLPKKSDSTGVIIDTVLRLATMTGRRLKILRSDNGGEFNNKALSGFLASQGISTERSIAYHHYQNGTIERYNRTLQDMGRTILLDSTLPKPFWGLAFVWACYTLNRIPNAASGELTPFERFFGQKPNLD
jgi:transposase InsO family protein